jgi:hypothetical protein
MTGGTLRRGDLVEVKSAEEILATIDATGARDALPFMPEMLKLVGRRFVVDQRAEKICDTVHYTGSERIPDAVLLDAPRCDGSSHGGCQAECRLFWKDAWLRRVGRDDPAMPQAADSTPVSLAELLERGTRSSAGTLDDGRYRCQATELFNASERLRVWDPRAYLRVLISGNVAISYFVRIMSRAVLSEGLRKLGRRSDMPLAGTATKSSPHRIPLGLKPGDRVHVRDRVGLAGTLNKKGQTRGLWFDREMLPYAGKAFTVRRRITHFIDDQSGEMIRLKTDCLTLEGVVCCGENSSGRWFCPRAIYPYWRESWLERDEAVQVGRNEQERSRAEARA